MEDYCLSSRAQSVIRHKRVRTLSVTAGSVRIVTDDVLQNDCKRLLAHTYCKDVTQFILCDFADQLRFPMLTLRARPARGSCLARTAFIPAFDLIPSSV
jgi:hypothetical protein